MPRFTLLSDWLAWLETLHPKSIDLGLSRVYRVAQQLKLLNPPSSVSHAYSGSLTSGAYTFIVAGTNGKGSCVATIESLLLAQGKEVGSYTSPHLHHYCERIKIGGEPVAESLVCEAFAAIDQARGDISLTYFEFGTLAALWIFAQRNIPYIALEVGLGGRLDAVNIVDADIAVVTSIAVDHEEWLGSDREQIAREKLGVTRANSPVVIAEQHLTDSLYEFIAQHRQSSDLSVINESFSATTDGQNLWRWQHRETSYSLPLPSLPLSSVAAAMEALVLSDLLPDIAQCRQVLSVLSLAGRYQQQCIDNRTVIFDVAHNPAASLVLAHRLSQKASNDKENIVSKTFAVFSVMEDKDIVGIVNPLHRVINHWYLGGLSNNLRSAPASLVIDVLKEQTKNYYGVETIEQAFDQALSESAEHDRIVVFGSFFTVAAIQEHIRHRNVYTVDSNQSRSN
ncbi:bifunctional tetrahydrofolate synthase/dihydrofolate synthase [Eionea flava]